MPKKIYIPDEVRESILSHLKSSIARATEAYENASEEEDTLTGQLGFSLNCKTKKVVVKGDRQKEQMPGTWKWFLKYTKFRGRGPNATENILGADGIFEFGVKYGRRFRKKSLLFQAKNNLSADKQLFYQSLKLSTWREAAFVINFTPDEIEAFYIDDVVRSQGVRKNIPEIIPLYDFMSDIFIECLIGDINLEYNARAHRLIWISNSGGRVNTKFSVKNRFSLEVFPPDYKDSDYGRSVPPSEIYNHRMQFSPEDLFSLQGSFTNSELRKARNRYALAYHSDRTNELEDLLMQIKKRRMQEANYVFEELKRKKHK